MTEQTVILRGHQPATFKGQKRAILDALLARRGEWIPAYTLAHIALQYCARITELRSNGYIIENKTERVGRQIRGAFRLVSCPGEATEVSHA
jgi:hypothetical protein